MMTIAQKFIAGKAIDMKQFLSMASLKEEKIKRTIREEIRATPLDLQDPANQVIEPTHIVILILNLQKLTLKRILKLYPPRKVLIEMAIIRVQPSNNKVRKASNWYRQINHKGRNSHLSIM